MADDGVSLSGVDEFLARLEASPEVMAALNRKAMEAALKRVGEVAKGAAPKLSGELAGSVRGTVTGSGNELLGRVRPTSKKAAMVEGGTGTFKKGERIKPRRKKAMAWGGIVRTSTAGMKGHPFMRPAKLAAKAEGRIAFEAEIRAIRDELAGH